MRNLTGYADVSEIDWSATGDMLSGLGTLGGAIVIAITAYLGRDALNMFVLQHQSERKLQHAEAILTAAYKIARALDAIRNPFASSHELEISKKELEGNNSFDDIPKIRRDRHIQANVFYIRARYFNDDFDHAENLVPVAAAFFGKIVKDALESLIKNRFNVSIYADAYSRSIGSDEDFDRKISAAMWKGSATNPEHDEITISTNKAISELEENLFPVVRHQAQK